MKMTSDQFEAKLKEIVKATMDEKMNPMIASQEKAAQDLDERIDAKIKEIVAQTRGQHIEIHDRFEDDKKGGFKSFGHFCHDVVKATVNPRDYTETLQTYESKVKELQMAQKAAGTGMMVGDNEFGGYLIPTEFRNTLLNAVEEKNELLPRCTVIPMATNSLEIPAVNGYDNSGGLVFGGVEMLWTDELGSYTEKRPKLEKVGLKLHKLTGLAYVTDEMLKFSPISMDAFLRQAFQNALNFQYNKVLMRGTGAGQPQGVLNAPCKVTVTKETGQPTGTIYYENILKMYASIYDASDAVWVANQNTLPQLATMALAVGTGGAPVWIPAGGASGKPYNTLMGLPLFWNDHASSLSTEGDISLVSWSQYLLGQLSSDSFDMPGLEQSLHLKFDLGQVAFRIQMYLAGQSWWRTYFTPPMATTSYRSPIVTLQDR